MNEIKRPSHFFVTSIDWKEDKLGKYRAPQCCAGYTDNFKEAEEAVFEDIGDLSEGGSNEYVVIEEYYMGVFAMLVNTGDKYNEWWYHWKSSGGHEGKYERCEKPEWSEGICRWSL